MALQVWCPFTLDTRQQGLGDISIPISASQGSIVTNGKLGKCLKTTVTGNIETTYIPDLNSSNYSIGGWFKFNKSELQTALSNLDYTSIKTFAMGNLIGNNSYGGLGLCWNSNDMYASSRVFNRLDIFGCLRTSSAGVQNVGTIIVDFDVWVHIFLVFDRTHKTLSLYKNGSLIQSKTITDFSDGVSHKLYINYGAVTAGNGPRACIPFYMNDFRLYDHALAPKEIEILSRGLVCHYPLSDSAIEATTNLVISLTAGTRTTKSADGTSIITNGENADTYFYINTSEAITTNTIYTFSCYVTGASGDSKYGYKINNESSLAFYLKNGYNEYTFSATSSMNNKTQILIDDGTRPETITSITITNIQLEKKDHATLYAGLGGTRSGDTTVYDCSGFQNNGTVSGSPTVSNDTARYSVSTNFAKSPYIQTTLPLPNGDGKHYTFSWWGKYTNYSGHMMWGYANGNRLNLYMASGNFYWNTGDGSNNPFGVSAATYGNNAWHHFVVTGDGTVTKLYIDGEFKADAKAYKPITGTTLIFNGWATSTDYDFNGSLSDFRLYATALSAAQVAELYNTAVSVANNGTLLGYELVEV